MATVYYKTDSEIELIRKSCLLVCATLTEVASHLKDGISGTELDTIAETFIRDHDGAVPGFKGYRDFPATLCISKNDEVVHGIPSGYIFKNGDIVSIDCGVYWDEFFGDAAYTFAIGSIDDDTLKLLVNTKESLYKGIEQAVAGNRLGDISFAIQDYTEKSKGYGVVRELVGHGIGRNLHEGPEVPNYGSRGRGPLLKEGLVIAIEPMVNLGSKSVKTAKDNWTIITKDGKPSAHYEHTIAVRKDKADILSDHAGIETAIKNNPELIEISLKS